MFAAPPGDEEIASDARANSLLPEGLVDAVDWAAQGRARQQHIGGCAQHLTAQSTFTSVPHSSHPAASSPPPQLGSSPVPGSSFFNCSSFQQHPPARQLSASALPGDQPCSGDNLGGLSFVSQSSSSSLIGLSPASSLTTVAHSPSSALPVPCPSSTLRTCMSPPPPPAASSALDMAGAATKHFLQAASNGGCGSEADNSAVSNSSNTNSPTSCPTSITVTASTDSTHAAGLVNFALSQPGTGSFTLVASMPPQLASNSPGANAALCKALKVAGTARSIHQSTNPATDLAVQPVFPAAPDNAPGTIELHVYHVKGMQASWAAGVPSIRVEPQGNHQLLVMHMTQLALNGRQNSQPGLQPLEVCFGPAAARIALQVLLRVQANITSSTGQDVVLLPTQYQQKEQQQTTMLFCMQLMPVSQVMQQADSQDADLQNQMNALQQLLQAAASLPDSQPNQLHHAGSMNNLHHAGSMNNLNHAGSLGYPDAGNYHGHSRPNSFTQQLGPGSMPMHVPGSASASAFNNAPSADAQFAAALAYQALTQSKQYDAYSMPRTSSATHMGPGMSPLNMAGVLEAARAGAAAATAAVQAMAAQQASAELPAGGSAGRPRARKADWVIVTEDTAIKNAAGAVAKVLGRVGPQGLCCPIYMERKTARYTTVVSVAVKAIAVARGYIGNEGSDQDVGFQPYVRGDPSACAFGAARPPGAPCVSTSQHGLSQVDALHQAMTLGGNTSDSMMSARLLSLASGDLSELIRQSSSRMGGSPPGTSPRGSSPSLLGSSPPLLGGSPPLMGGSPPLLGGSPTAAAAALWPHPLMDISGGSQGSSVCGDDDGAPSALSELDQVELAFDVYKVSLPQTDPAAAAGSLPVKVTAHSRPGVVANIICKLVLERSSAVLITAGGRAMHVAMLAVVHTRRRLLGHGVDVLLLPKFVTVDTSATLGWESVFLRFNIIKWSPAAALAADLTSRLALGDNR